MTIHLVQLKAHVQHYLWGQHTKDSIIKDFLKVNGDVDIREDDTLAEIWAGDHPTLPSQILSTDLENTEFLSTWLKRNGYNHSLPFLFKILTIRRALSIQAHPDKILAATLHQRDSIHYPDRYHKPEIAVAISPMEALCGFRPISEIAHFCNTIQEFSLVWTDFHSSESEIDSIRHGVQRMYDLSSAFIEEQTYSLTQRYDKKSNSLIPEVNLFLRLQEQFPNDVGCWFVFILRYVRLQPFEGLFLRPNEPHAYISGDCLEVMRSSDNVVRGGLTPKFKDIETFLSMMTYDSQNGLNMRLTPQFSNSVYEYFPTPAKDFPEFRMVVFHLDAKRRSASYSIDPSGDQDSKTHNGCPILIYVIRGTVEMKYSTDTTGIARYLSSSTVWCLYTTVLPLRISLHLTQESDGTLAMALPNAII